MRPLQIKLRMVTPSGEAGLRVIGYLSDLCAVAIDHRSEHECDENYMTIWTQMMWLCRHASIRRPALMPLSLVVIVLLRSESWRSFYIASMHVLQVKVVRETWPRTSSRLNAVGTYTPGHGYWHYETSAGGSRVGTGWHYANGAHVCMTNMYITDCDIFQLCYPCTADESACAADLAARQYKGGEGCVRENEFRRPLSVFILSDRQWYGPYGSYAADTEL